MRDLDEYFLMVMFMFFLQILFNLNRRTWQWKGLVFVEKKKEKKRMIESLAYSITRLFL